MNAARRAPVSAEPVLPVEVHTGQDEDGWSRYIGGAEAITVARFEIHRSWLWEARRHDRHQLLWAPAGAVTLQTERLDWLAPPTTALWIPAGEVHTVNGAQRARVYSLYLEPPRCPITWPATTPVAVSPLVRELIVYLDNPELTAAVRRHVEAVLYHCLEPVSMTTLRLPMPADPRVREVADALLADPADQRELPEWGRAVGASVRTLTRAFVAETGMTFTQWRLHTRIRAAMHLLAAGVTVAATAKQVGYRTPSAFGQAFRRVTGATPSGYFGRARHNREPQEAKPGLEVGATRMLAVARQKLAAER